MKTSEYKVWWEGLAQLSREQRERLRAHLQGEADRDTVVPLLEHSLTEPVCCPHCAGAQTLRWGKVSGLVSLPGLPQDLQRLDRHTLGASAPQGVLAALRAGLG